MENKNKVMYINRCREGEMLIIPYLIARYKDHQMWKEE